MKRCEKLVYGRLISCAIERLRVYQHITAPKVIRHVFSDYVIVEFEGNLRYMLKLCSGYWLYHRVELTRCRMLGDLKTGRGGASPSEICADQPIYSARPRMFFNVGLCITARSELPFEIGRDSLFLPRNVSFVPL